jgi:DNA-binding transcriptional regulator GbsR (MarR family)
MPPPKIYISHRPLTLEETAEMVGVSKSRLEELKVIIADLKKPKRSRRSKPTVKQSARK